MEFSKPIFENLVMHSGHQRSSSSLGHVRIENNHESKAVGVLGDEAQVASTDEAEKDCILPNGGYGWVCVICAFLINMHTWGISFVSQSFVMPFSWLYPLAVG